MNDQVIIKSPLLRYHGGKFRLAPWIISNMPDHSVYVEAFGGGGSVLLRKPRANEEIYNEIDTELAKLFDLLTSNKAPLLREVVARTPYSEESYRAALKPACWRYVENARRLIVRSHMGFHPLTGGELSLKAPTGFRSHPAPTRRWATFADDVLEGVIRRVREVQIENRNAIDILDTYDGKDVLFYLDPPYLPQVRVSKTPYQYDMTEAGHRDLLEKIISLKGAVMISGYDNALYNLYLRGWHKLTHSARISARKGQGRRTEYLWIKEAEK